MLSDGLAVRTFQIKAFHKTEFVGNFMLEYIHTHEKLYFIYLPQLTIFEWQASDEIGKILASVMLRDRQQ